MCKKGTLNENWPWKRKDINYEFFLRFALTDEGFSWYLNENKNLAGNASVIDESKYRENSFLMKIVTRLYSLF